MAGRPCYNCYKMWRITTTRYSVNFQKFPSRVRVVQKNPSSIRVAGTRWTLVMTMQYFKARAGQDLSVIVWVITTSEVFFSISKYFQKIATTLIPVFRAKPVSFQKCLWKQEWMPKDQNLKDKRRNPRNAKWNSRF